MRLQNLNLNPPLIIKTSPNRLLLLFICGVVILIMVADLFFGEPHRPTALRVFFQPIVGLLGLGMGLIGLIGPLFMYGKKVVTLSEDGLSFRGGRFIPWDQLEEMEAFKAWGGGWMATFILKAGSEQYVELGPYYNFSFGTISPNDFELIKGVVEEKAGFVEIDINED